MTQADLYTRNYSRDSSVTKMLVDLKWETLKIRRDKARLTTLYKETHGMIPSNISHYLQSSNSNKHNYRTRQTGSFKYEVMATNKDCYRHSLGYTPRPFPNGTYWMTKRGTPPALIPSKLNWIH